MTSPRGRRTGGGGGTLLLPLLLLALAAATASALVTDHFVIDTPAVDTTDTAPIKITFESCENYDGDDSSDVRVSVSLVDPVPLEDIAGIAFTLGVDAATVAELQVNVIAATVKPDPQGFAPVVVLDKHNVTKATAHALGLQDLSIDGGVLNSAAFDAGILISQSGSGVGNQRAVVQEFSFVLSWPGHSINAKQLFGGQKIFARVRATGGTYAGSKMLDTFDSLHDCTHCTAATLAACANANNALDTPVSCASGEPLDFAAILGDCAPTGATLTPTPALTECPAAATDVSVAVSDAGTTCYSVLVSVQPSSAIVALDACDGATWSGNNAVSITCGKPDSIAAAAELSPVTPSAGEIVSSDYTVDISTQVCLATFNRTWVPSCASLEPNPFVQVFTLADDAPVISGSAPSSTVQCAADVAATKPAAGAITATDTCEGDVAVILSEATADEACPNQFTLTRTYAAQDSCGHAAAPLVQVISVRDAVKPVLSSTPAAAVTVTCASDVPAAATLTATDNCDTVTVDFAEVKTAGACANRFTLARSWEATDSCGNAVKAAQLVTVFNDGAPVLTAPEDAEVECAGEATDISTDSLGVATAVDACGGALPATAVTHEDETQEGATTCEKVVKRTWTAVDACGNTASAVQTITVVDTTKPRLTASAPADVTVQCLADLNKMTAYSNPDPLAASDACKGVFYQSATGPALSTAANRCDEKYAVTWTPDDGCGNAGTAVTQTFTVKPTAAPTMQEPAVRASQQCRSQVPAAETLSATGPCGNAVDVKNDTTETGTECGGGKVTYTYTATDCDKTTTKTQVINFKDETKPTLSGGAPLFSCCSTLGAALVGAPTAPACTDACNTCTPGSSRSRTPTCGTTATYTYTGTDACGNKDSMPLLHGGCFCQQTMVAGPGPLVDDKTKAAVTAPWSLLTATSDNTRWGWVAKLTSAAPSVTGALWAGAGGSIRAKGVHAGNVTLTRGGVVLTVAIALNAGSTINANTDTHIGVQCNSAITSTSFGTNPPYLQAPRDTKVSTTAPYLSGAPAVTAATATAGAVVTFNVRLPATAACAATNPLYVVVHTAGAGAKACAPPS